MNVVQAMPPMMKYRPRAATIATYSQSGRPLGRRWSCICITSVVPGGSSRQCAPSCEACDSSIAASATSTPCLQSQIQQDRHLRRQRTAQVEAAVALAVVVRWGPVRTGVNGTVVARRWAELRCGSTSREERPDGRSSPNCSPCLQEALDPAQDLWLIDAVGEPRPGAVGVDHK